MFEWLNTPITWWSLMLGVIIGLIIGVISSKLFTFLIKSILRKFNIKV